MPLSRGDRDLIKSMINQSIDSRGYLDNQLKGHGMDRREDKMIEVVAFAEKGDDETSPIGLGMTIAS